jgi:hypothetical protein
MQKSIVLTLIVLLISACAPQPPPTAVGTCEIAPAGTGGVIIHMLPSAASNDFGFLSETTKATAKTADGFYGFDPGVAQAGNSGLFRLRWVLKTHNVTTSPGCANIPIVVGPIAGLCYAMIGMDAAVYSSADGTSSVLVTLHRDDFVMVTGSEADWYTVDLNVGTMSMDAIGYLNRGSIGGLKGSCDGY